MFRGTVAIKKRKINKSRSLYPGHFWYNHSSFQSVLYLPTAGSIQSLVIQSSFSLIPPPHTNTFLPFCAHYTEIYSKADNNSCIHFSTSHSEVIGLQINPLHAYRQTFISKNYKLFLDLALLTSSEKL